MSHPADLPSAPPRADDHLTASLGPWLEQLCDEAIYGTAGQAYAFDRGGEADAVAGRSAFGPSLGADAVAEVYCLTKPIVAAAALLACEQAGLDPLDPLHGVLPGARHLDDDVSVAGVLAHRARLQWPSGLAWTTLRPADRPDVGDLVQLPPGTHGYSEVAGWLVLTRLIEALTGMPAAAHVGRNVTGPLGIEDEVLLDGPALERALAEGRILVGTAGLPASNLPMWHVAQPGYLRRASTAFGGMASGRAIGRFARAMGRVVTGEVVDGLPSPATILRARAVPSTPRSDATWRRPAGFALGFELVEVDGAERWQLTSGVSAAGVVLVPTEGWGAAFTLDGISLGSADIATTRDDLARRVTPGAVRR